MHTVLKANSHAKAYNEDRLDHGDDPAVPKNALCQSLSDSFQTPRAVLKEVQNSPDHYQKQLEDYHKGE